MNVAPRVVTPSTYPVVLAGRIVVGGILDSYRVVVFLILFLPSHILRDLRFYVTEALENINVDSYNSQTQTGRCQSRDIRGVI